MLAGLYAMAAQCWMAGRVEAALGYEDALQRVIDSGGGQMPFGIEGMLGGAYLAIGQPERTVELCLAQLAQGHDSHGFIRASLVLALTLAGSHDEAMAVGKGLIDTAEATRNPWARSLAFFGCGFAFSATDSVRALDAMRRGLVIAQDSGNRANESFLAIALARVEAEHGDPLAALDYVTLAIRRHHDSGNVALIRPALAILAAFLDRLGRCEPAATIAGFAFNPLSATTFPEINSVIAHLREVLGDQTYESLARQGETMTAAAIATYAYDQIDQARTELEHEHLS